LEKPNNGAEEHRPETDDEGPFAKNVHDATHSRPARVRNLIRQLRRQRHEGSDFNGDGQADLLLQNSQTEETAFWLMNGTNYTGWSGLGVMLNPTGFTALPVDWRVME
jgi:hypothetical protein